MVTIKHIAVMAGIVSAAFTVSTQASSLNKLEGVWKSVGYGNIVEIKKSQARVYYVTDISCTTHDEFSFDVNSKSVNRVDVTEENKMSYYVGGGITRYDYTRLSALPASCANGLQQDPEYNFEVFWRAYNDHYAFFNVRGIDWAAIYEKYRPRVTKNTTSEELFKVFTEIAVLLKDGHVNIVSPDEEFNASPDGTFSTLMSKAFDQETTPTDGSVEADRYLPEATHVAKNIISRRYLKETKKTAFTKPHLDTPKTTTAENSIFMWGWADEGIGYISLDLMQDYVPEQASAKERRDAVDALMTQILTDLGGAKGLIVDARWNGGGFDQNALAIAGYLTDQNLLAFTKKARLGEGYTPVQRVFIPAYAKSPYTGPIVYLQGRDTFSAAEIFSMAMQAMPNVTSVGENTGGGFSDIFAFPLPNGWVVTMSNEVYIASDGKSYEGVGIPSDIAIVPQKDDTLESYVVRGMDTAISFLKNKN